MSQPQHKRELEAYYRKQLGGRTVFWQDKCKPYLSLYRDRTVIRNAAIAAALPDRMDCGIDLGCGQGDLLVVLGQRCRCALGLDYAEVMARTARANLREFPAVRVLCSTAECLPVRDQSADAVILADVIEHVIDPGACLRECRRVLKSGGRLVLTTPNAPVEQFWKRFDGMFNAPFEWWNRRRHRPLSAVFERLEDRPTLAARALEAGFSIETHRRIEFYPGSEGSGVFGRVLRLIARQRHLREWVVEPVLRTVFGWIARLEVFNNRQLLVLVRPPSRSEDLAAAT